ncbi:sugar isomerase domain-containing protein [Bdellovibrionota bacterium FG-1]
MSMLGVDAFGAVALPHLGALVGNNREVLERLVGRLVLDIPQGKSLLVFGSGHSAMFPMEIYHRAGGPSFVLPLVADYLLPTAGPPVVRLLERTPGVATPLLNRAEPREGEMLWLCSQSGINAAVVDLALEANRRGMTTVAFTSVAHSGAVSSRHPSGQRLFQVCAETVDLAGVRGDAAVPIGSDVSAGPLSSLSAIFLAHSILVAAMAQLEKSGVRCVYTSVNTPEGEARNRSMELIASRRDPLLR